CPCRRHPSVRVQPHASGLYTKEWLFKRTDFLENKWAISCPLVTVPAPVTPEQTRIHTDVARLALPQRRCIKGVRAQPCSNGVQKCDSMRTCRNFHMPWSRTYWSWYVAAPHTAWLPLV